MSSPPSSCSATATIASVASESATEPTATAASGSESATERAHVLVDVVDDDGRAVAREPARDRLADPAPGPGDERHASLERAGHQ